MNFDQVIDAAVAPLADFLAAVVFYAPEVFGARLPLVVAWLVVAGVFFTVYLGFINLRGFGHALKLVRGGAAGTGGSSGEVSHFEALTTAVSGTVGVSNIALVPVAIAIGGPGAAFWIIVAGFLGMSTKFAECTLGVKYRREAADGTVSGGPMYFISRGLAERNLPRLGRVLGAFYAACIMVGCIGIGNMLQSNQAFSQFVNVTGGDGSWFADKGWLFGTALALLTASVIIGGIQSIARVTSRLVPFMAVLYLGCGLVVLLANWQALPAAVAAMVGGAFTSEGVAGGALGALVVGFQRALFSNEAGLGSASIAHSAVRTDKPVTEGYVSLLEPFIDTIVICTTTALVIITTGHLQPGFLPDGAAGLGAGEGIVMTSQAFARVLPWFPVPLAVAAMLFAFSTTLAWSYYGLKGFQYLVGEGVRAERLFQGVFCVFVAVGCMVQLQAVLDLSDALVFIICVPNVLALYLLAPVVKSELQRYRQELSG